MIELRLYRCRISDRRNFHKRGDRAVARRLKARCQTVSSIRPGYARTSDRLESNDHLFSRAGYSIPGTAEIDWSTLSVGTFDSACQHHHAPYEDREPNSI